MTTLTAVITCYREGELIYNALNSLFNQTDCDFDIIVVNGCSPDEATNRVCHEIEYSKKAKVIFEKVNNGMGISRNTAFEEMTSEVAVFLDADDTLPLDAIENIRKTFDQYPDADFVFGNYIVNYIEKNTTETVVCSILTDTNGKLSPIKLANNWKLIGSSPCKKSLWQKIGGYALEFSNTTNDVDFWQRAILVGGVGYYVNSEIYLWNRSIHGLNSSKAFSMALDSCLYKNIDFVILYSNIYKEGFNIALKNKNYAKIKQWAVHEISSKKHCTFLATIFYLCPLFLLPLLTNIFLIAKKIIKK